MTREEAIYRLKNMAWLYGSAEREQNIKAIDMAIEALQFLEHFDLLKEYQSLQEVVRCKDCIHWFPHTQCGFDEDNDEYHDYCGLLIPDDDYYAYRRTANDYCSYGERKGGDNE